jgi:hypothetical protein
MWLLMPTSRTTIVEHSDSAALEAIKIAMVLAQLLALLNPNRVVHDCLGCLGCGCGGAFWKRSITLHSQPEPWHSNTDTQSTPTRYMALGQREVGLREVGLRNV